MTVLIRRAQPTGLTAPGVAVPGATGGRRWAVRWWWFLLVALAYGVVSLTLDPRGQIGSDAAAKVSALESMEVEHSNVPEVRYWASEHDPDGRLFPVYNSMQVEGRWIPVSTLPMIELMWPLYRVGGVRLALLVPMVGALACAWAAAALARRLGADARAAFFVVALASPVTIYAMTIWEHTLGLGGIAWGAVVLLDIRRGVRSWHWGLLAGGLFGAAATMRTEAFVYGAVLTSVFAIASARQTRSALTALRIGLATLAGLQIPLLANSLLERSVLGVDFRSSRASGVASASGTEPLTRLRDGAVGLFAVVANDSIVSIGVGVVFALTVACAVWCWSSPDKGERARQLMVVAGVIMAVMCTTGLGFVPGLLPTAPLALAAVVVLRCREPEAREMALAAVVAIAVVWLTQYTSNVVPQWSGRYVLASGLFLVVLGLRATVPIATRRALIGFSVAITLFGLVWTGQRTRDVSDFFGALDATQSDVVFSRDRNLLREAGARVVGQQWLASDRAEDSTLAFEIARDARAETVLVIQRDDQTDLSPPACYDEAGRARRRFLPNATFTLVTYQITAACPPTT